MIHVNNGFQLAKTVKTDLSTHRKTFFVQITDLSTHKNSFFVQNKSCLQNCINFLLLTFSHFLVFIE